MWSLRQSLSQYSVVKLLPENPNISQLFGTGKDYSDGFFTSRDTKIKCGVYVSLFRSILLSNYCQKTLIFLNYLEQEKTTRMASSPECIIWMVVGLTESVTIVVLNSLTGIAFFRDRNLRKRSTYLVISLAVADMLSGGPSSLELFSTVGVICNFWGYNHCIGIRYYRSYSSAFLFVR